MSMHLPLFQMSALCVTSPCDATHEDFSRVVLGDKWRFDPLEEIKLKFSGCRVITVWRLLASFDKYTKLKCALATEKIPTIQQPIVQHKQSSLSGSLNGKFPSFKNFVVAPNPCDSEVDWKSGFTHPVHVQIRFRALWRFFWRF